MRKLATCIIIANHHNNTAGNKRIAANPYKDLEDEDDKAIHPHHGSPGNTSTYSFAHRLPTTPTSRLKHSRPQDSDDDDSRPIHLNRKKNHRIKPTAWTEPINLAGNPYQDLEDEDDYPPLPHRVTSANASNTKRFKDAQSLNPDDDGNRSPTITRNSNLWQGRTTVSVDKIPAVDPYQNLEDEDNNPPLSYRASSTNSFHRSPAHAYITTATTRFKHARHQYSDDEDDHSAAAIRAKNLRMNTTRSSDTRVPADNRSMASVFNHKVYSKSSTVPTIRFGDNIYAKKIAPAFSMKTPAENVKPSSIGYQYQANKPQLEQLVRSWTTLDPDTGKQNARGPKAFQPKHSDDARDPINGPLAATFGTTKLKEANIGDNGTTHLVFDNIDQDDMFVPQPPPSTLINNHDEHNNPATTTPIPFNTSSPIITDCSTSNAESNEHSSALSSVYTSDRNSTVSIDTSRSTTDTNPLIHADVRANFVTDINALHDMHAPETNFWKLNSDWRAADPSTVKCITINIGHGNVTQLKVKSEDRTRNMNMLGRYNHRNNSHGEVAKRFRRGFMEMIDRLEKEMLNASEEYRKWATMSPSKRVQLLAAIRRPVVQFNGTWVAAELDSNSPEIPLPLIYQQRAADHRREVRMVRDRIERDSIASQHSISVTSMSSRDTRDAIGGTLGDCDSQYIFAAHIHGGHTNDDIGSNNKLLSSAQQTLQRLTQFEAREYRQRGSSRRDKIDRIERNANNRAASNSSHATVKPQNTPSIHSSAQLSFKTASRARRTPSNTSTISLMPPPSNSRASNHYPNTDNTIRNIRTSGHGGSNSTTTGRSVTDGINNFRDLLDSDDSPELQIPPDIVGFDAIHLEGNAKKYLDIAVDGSTGRGRVVVVRLHQVVEFTPGAIAQRVFGGNVQEFQLHPHRSTAVVIFLHANEARSFVHHYLNVRAHGTAQEIRELQMEVSWYR